MADWDPLVNDIFLKAIEAGSPADRAAVLDRSCRDDADLRRKVEALLRAHDGAGSFLDRPAPGLAADPAGTRTLPDPDAAPPAAHETTEALGPDPAPADGDAPRPIAEGPGARIGPYKILQGIGEGGMGAVYMAEQEHPVRRKVALKLIKPGMDSRDVLSRFESERQALAMMDHPNIARVFDAGRTDSGRPFFVMELVRGIPLTEYCDRHRLSVPERLAMFRPICSAVQHAHQKGIIHRDLKPTNILVESHDDRPVPKVIDFGLAKATGGMRLTEQSLFTAFGGVAGTPLYMAPEQAAFNALDIDTRADIYALGAILYELLTGSTPIARESVQRAALDELFRVIREVEPPTPSSRISTAEVLPSLAAGRQVELARLSRMVRGELDWIVMKALAKERERRYDSAIALADDLERYLHHEAVSAGPPTAAYRLRKFVRRHRAPVVAASLVLLALVLGVVGTALGLVEARRQQRKAVAEAAAKEDALRAEAEQRRIADDLRLRAEKRLGQVEKMADILGSVFKDIDPRRAEEGEKPLSAILAERLDRAAAEIQGEATGNPLAVARMQIIVGHSLKNLGYSDRAIQLFTRARDAFASRLGPDDPRTLASLAGLAAAHEAAGHFDEAIQLSEEVVAARKAKLGPDHPDTLNSMANLAGAYHSAGRRERALESYEEVLPLQRAKLGPDHPDTLNTMAGLAACDLDSGKPDQGIALLEAILEHARHGPDVILRTTITSNLAGAYTTIGRLDRAIAVNEEALALARAKLGPDHSATLRILDNLAAIHGRLGRLDRTVGLYEEVLASRRAKHGRDHVDTIRSMRNVAIGYAGIGQFDRATALFEEALPLMRAKFGPEHPVTVEGLEYFGECLAESGQFGRAEAILDELIAAHRKARGDAHTDTLRARIIRANLDGTRGRVEAAESAFRAILDDCRSHIGPEHRLRIEAALGLARALEARGAGERAAASFRAAIESARKNPAERVLLALILRESGSERLAAGDWAAAEAQFREALAIFGGVMGRHWMTDEARSLLGSALLGQGRAAEAGPLLRSGYEGMAAKAAEILPPLGSRLAEALDRLIAAGEAAGSKAEVEAWKAARAKLGVGADPKPGSGGR